MAAKASTIKTATSAEMMTFAPPSKQHFDFANGAVVDEAAERQKYVDGLVTELTGGPFTFRVSGYKIALYIPKGDERVGKTGAIIAPEEYRNNQVLKANCGMVLALGPDAYRDPERYPSGPWCKVGDWVGFQRYETTAALMGWRGITIALIPDDKIDGVAEKRQDLTDILKRDLL